MFAFVGRLAPRAALGLIAVAVLALFWTAGPALAAGKVRTGPLPAWVKPVAPPEPKAERIRQVADGIYYLLLDNQDRPASPLDQRFVRQVYKVTDRSGLEAAARIDILFDPASEDVTLHRLQVWRDGKAQDRLKGADIQLIRREKDLDKGIMDGRKTAHIELKDVRVGDLVEYAYSVENSDPLLAGTYAGDLSTTWSTPVALTRFRLLWPHGRPITVRAYSGAPAPTVRPGRDRDEYVWESVDPAPTQKEDDAPNWIDQWGRITVSSMTSWREVAAWSLPFYTGRGELTPEWAAKVDAIARKYPAAADRITEALRLVQDDIRYVSLSIGEGSYRPRAPAEVIRSGYGDCKDKALLLTTVLARLGVAAAPALTDSTRGRALNDEGPNASAFDHAIVRIELGGKAYWVDPTASQQGGRFPNLETLFYGLALPVRPGQAGLEPIPVAPPAQPMTDVVERYELPRGSHADLKLTVISTFAADGANSMRDHLASQSLAEFEKKYFDYYAGMYPGIRRERPVEVSDDRDANLVVLREAYLIPAASLAKDGLAKTFPIKASALTSYKVPDARERRFPFWVDFPVNDRHRIVIVSPGRRPPAPAKLEIDGKTFHFVRAAVRDGDTLTITETLKSVREVVPPAEVADYRADASRLGDEVASNLDLTSNAGGQIGGRDTLIAWVVGLIVLGAITALAAVGLRWGAAGDAAWAGEGQFYPVSLRKFVLMCLATGGLYPFFWTWKSWRWAKAYDGQDIQPFWRALFSVFWIYALFAQINRRLARPLPAWTGIAATAAYVLWAVGDAVLNRWKEAPLWLHVAGLTSFVCLLPHVVAVARLNGPDNAALKANSRFGWRAAVAIAASAAFYALAFSAWYV